MRITVIVVILCISAKSAFPNILRKHHKHYSANNASERPHNPRTTVQYTTPEFGTGNIQNIEKEKCTTHPNEINEETTKILEKSSGKITLEGDSTKTTVYYTTPCFGTCNPQSLLKEKTTTENNRSEVTSTKKTKTKRKPRRKHRKHKARNTTEMLDITTIKTTRKTKAPKNYGNAFEGEKLTTYIPTHDDKWENNPRNQVSQTLKQNNINEHSKNQQNIATIEITK